MMRNLLEWETEADLPIKCLSGFGPGLRGLYRYWGNFPMKKCPFCAEEIQDAAIKCKHCGEWLEKDIKNSLTQVVGVKKTEPFESEPQAEFVLSESSEEINKKKEAGLKQCPTCGEWDVHTAFVDGGYGDWCPHCKKAIDGPKLKDKF